MLEVFTIGGGEYVVNTFNAVAAWTGGGGFRSALQVVFVMGFIYSLMMVAFSLDWRAWFNWFLQSGLVYMMLIVPTVSVKVTDRIDPGLPAAVVDNVPLGLGVMASFTSQLDDWMTRTAETVFVMPNALALTNNGMIYGARLLEKAQTFEITDATFRANLDEHLKQCVFYDVLLGFKSMNDLQKTDDLWATIGPGSPARAQKWITETSGTTDATVIPCNEAYDNMSARWTQELDASVPIFAKTAYPKLASAVAAQKLKQDLPQISQAMHGTSKDAYAYLKQVSMLDAFRAARESFSDAGWDAYASQRADAQAKNTYTSIAQQAMTWVPLLNIVLTVVFYAMFPVIFPLFLFPRTGIATLKGYATGFFYLAAWGPLYVILHMFVMSRAADAYAAMSPSGPTLLVSDGIQAVNNDIATIAGFLMMSVPFLAAGLARGAMAIAGQATSMLAPAQSAAEASAVERTTGNYAYGNTSFANTTANMLQANKWDSTPAFASGFASSTYNRADGSVERGFSNGTFANDASPRMSRLDTTISGREAVTNTLNTMLADERALSERISNTQVFGQGTTSSQATSSGTNRSRSTGSEQRNGSQWSNSSEAFQGGETGTGGRSDNIAQTGLQVSSGSSTRETESTSERSSNRYGAKASAGLKGELGLSLPGVGGGAYADKGVFGESSHDSSNSSDITNATDSARSHVGSEMRSDGHYSDNRQSSGNRSVQSSGTSGNDTDYAKNDITAFNNQSNELRFTSSEEKRHALEQSQQRISRLSNTILKVESGELSITGDISTPIGSQYEAWLATSSGDKTGYIHSWERAETGDQFALRNEKYRELAEAYLRPQVERQLAASGSLEDGAMEFDGRWKDTPHPTPLGQGGAGVSPATFPEAVAPSGARSLPEGAAVDGRRLAREEGVQIKPGARVAALDGRMQPVVGAVAAAADRLGLPTPVVTSGNDSHHKPHSRHYDNQAIDFRGNNISIADGKRLERDVQRQLGSGFRVEYEIFPKDPRNNHLHVQTRGKK